jgi:hypothetical protein
VSVQTAGNRARAAMFRPDAERRSVRDEQGLGRGEQLQPLGSPLTRVLFRAMRLMLKKAAIESAAPDLIG